MGWRQERPQFGDIAVPKAGVQNLFVGFKVDAKVTAQVSACRGRHVDAF